MQLLISVLVKFTARYWCQIGKYFSVLVENNYGGIILSIFGP